MGLTAAKFAAKWTFGWFSDKPEEYLRQKRAVIVADAALRNDPRFQTQTAVAKADPTAAAAKARLEKKDE